MAFAAWDSELSAPDKNGVPSRVSIEAAARRGVASSIAILASEPERPAALEYLWGWLQDVRLGLGVGMEGLASLTWVALDAWARRKDIAPQPHEIDALFLLDAILRNPAVYARMRAT